MSDKKELFFDVETHLLDDEKPSIYLSSLLDNPTFQEYPFSLLYAYKQTEQSPVHHPEGNVWNHVLMVVDQAAKLKDKSKDKRAFMWASLLHDIGKPTTTKIRKSKITSYDHDKVGEDLAIDFLNQFIDDDEFIQKVSKLVRYHMHILFVANSMPFGDIKGLLSETDFKEIALLGYCDRMGRTNSNKEKETDNINKFLRICKANKLNRVKHR